MLQRRISPVRPLVWSRVTQIIFASCPLMGTATGRELRAEFVDYGSNYYAEIRTDLRVRLTDTYRSCAVSADLRLAV